MLLQKKNSVVFHPLFIHILQAFGPKALVCVMIFGGSDSDSDLTTIRINIFSTINIVNKIDAQCS